MPFFGLWLRRALLLLLLPSFQLFGALRVVFGGGCVPYAGLRVRPLEDESLRPARGRADRRRCVPRLVARRTAPAIFHIRDKRSFRITRR
jgi:uncharacterized SAM-binding protein YcdF (DUF218 family)